MASTVEENYIKALKTANFHHGIQTYYASPYLKHLILVTQVLTRMGYSFAVYPDLHTCAILHDILSQTPCEYLELRAKFSDHIAEIVYDVTDELGKSRYEAMNKTIEKLKKNDNALIIKLAEKIAHIEECVDRDIYRGNYQIFRSSLFRDTQNIKIKEMWYVLDKLLEI